MVDLTREPRFRARKRKARKWAAIRQALSGPTEIRTNLDLPCGTGRFTGALAREGYEIIGSDISLEMAMCRPMPNICRCAMTHSIASCESDS